MTILPIQTLTNEELQALKALYSRCIPLAFEVQGLSSWTQAIEEEIAHKHAMIDEALHASDTLKGFRVMKIGNELVGAISFGLCGQDILQCTEGKWASLIEIGSLYVLPDHHRQGIASSLIEAVLVHLKSQGIKEFCLDSGYQQAQAIWKRKFGPPTLIVKDYWDIGSDHHLWRCPIHE